MSNSRGQALGPTVACKARRQPRLTLDDHFRVVATETSCSAPDSWTRLCLAVALRGPATCLGYEA
jgi:hypothetical protein